MKNISKAIFKNKKHPSEQFDREQFIKDQANNQAKIFKEVKTEVNENLKVLLPLLRFEKFDIEKSIYEFGITEGFSGDLIDILHNDQQRFGYLDWKNCLCEVLDIVNFYAEKQEFIEINQSQIDENLEIYCAEALQHLQTKTQNFTVYIINIGADGCFAGIISNDNAKLFEKTLNEIFVLLKSEDRVYIGNNVY